MTGLPPGPWSVLVADPPWLYQHSAGVNGDGDGAPGIAEREYDTMTMAQIAALPVADVAASDAHLFMWVTNPRLYGDRAGGVSPVDILTAWGFTYRTLITWVKTATAGRPDRGGMGWYFRGATEHVLYATKGAAAIPAPLREPNVLLAAKRRHSEKPAAFYAMVDRVVPEGRRLEMFARQPRPGWTVWGHEAGGTVTIDRAPEQSERLW